MKDWTYHYERAEGLLVTASDPSRSTYEVDALCQRAKVHATLAAIGYTPPAEPIKWDPKDSEIPF